MTTTEPRARQVRCPTCGGESLYSPTNPYRPFCSERCKSVDFGGWASESYRMKAEPPKDLDFEPPIPASK